MLKECHAVRQIPGEPFRRWYNDNETDLVVWLEQYRIIGFQLLVPREGNRVVITWHEGHSPTLAGLDDGEGRPGRPKMTPLLTDCNGSNTAEMMRHFRAVSAELPSGLAQLVEQKVAELGK